MSGGSAIGCWTPVKSGGSTPTIVTGTLFTRTVLPTTEASLPNRACQYFELMTATGGDVGVVGGQEGAADARANAEELEIVTARHECLRQLRLTGGRVDHVDPAERR